MSAREKRDVTRRALRRPQPGDMTRRSRQNGLEFVLGDHIRRTPEGHVAGPAAVGGSGATKGSYSSGRGKTPHSAKTPAFATTLNVSDEFGYTPISHPLIVITGDEPAAVAEATAALQAYRNPLEAAILASLLNNPADHDESKQTGGSGMIPPTQTMVFSRPGSSSSLRIRVVPFSTMCAPLVPYADWSRTMQAGDRHGSSASKISTSTWLNGS